MHFIGIIGSLRKDSWNRKVMNAAATLLPEGSTLEIVEIGNLPLFNQDLEANFPAEATAIKDKIKAADGVIFATPEYNRAMPAPLVNALDWASRPYGDSAWNGKPALIMGATGGSVGTALAQAALKETLSYLNMHVLGQPELYLGSIHEKFDAAGTLTDEKMKEMLTNALKTFADFAAKLK